jgi:hypothetical protein
MSHYYVRGANGKAQRWNPIKKDGTPYQIISKALAEKHKARIGITSQVGNHQNKDGLIGWAGRLGLQAGLDAAYEFVAAKLSPFMNDDERLAAFPKATIDYANELYNTARNEGSNRGTEVHDGIDAFLKGGELSNDPIIAVSQREVYKWLESQGVDMTHIHAEHCVIFEGGISVPTEDGQGIEKVLDIANGATADLITKRLLADWKTIGDNAKTGKADQAAQLAFCRHAAASEGLCDPKARCCNVYLSRDTGKIVEVKTWTEKELELGLIWAATCYEADKALAALEKEIK